MLANSVLSINFLQKETTPPVQCLTYLVYNIDKVGVLCLPVTLRLCNDSFGHSSVSQNAQRQFMRFWTVKKRKTSSLDMCPQAEVSAVNQRKDVKILVCCQISRFPTLLFRIWVKSVSSYNLEIHGG